MKIKKLIKNIFTKVADCIVPALPILIGIGMLKVLLIILGPLVLNILTEESDTYKVLSFVAEAGYYFIPIYIAISSAEIFNVNKYVAGLVGGMLLAPEYIKLVETNTAITVFKLPIALTSYANQMIPSIISIWILSYIYHFLDKHLSDNIKPILLPLISLIVMIPICFCLIGPLGVFLGNKLVELIMLLNSLGPIGNGIMSALIPLIVILGLSGGNLSAMLLLSSKGCDPILFFANVLYNTILGFAILALYIRNKKPDTLAAAIASSVAGTSEPAMYSYAIKDIKVFIIVMVADFCAGLYAGLMGVKTYAMTSFGSFGVIATIGPNSSILHAIISMIIGSAIAFTLTLITHPKK